MNKVIMRTRLWKLNNSLNNHSEAVKLWTNGEIDSNTGRKNGPQDALRPEKKNGPQDAETREEEWTTGCPGTREEEVKASRAQQIETTLDKNKLSNKYKKCKAGLGPI